MPITPDIPAAEAAIVATTNAFRKAHNLSALKPNAQLAAAARAYARSLAKMTILTHTANGTTPASRVKQAGYAYCEIAENLAMIYDSHGFTGPEYAQRAVAGWEKSPGHRKNMTMEYVTETGVGVATAGGADPRYIAVQLLGRPLALKYSFKIANKSPRAVSYAFAGQDHVAGQRTTITHTACVPGAITFAIDPKTKPVARYEARNGRVFTLTPAKDGDVTVEVGGGAK